MVEIGTSAPSKGRLLALHTVAVLVLGASALNGIPTLAREVRIAFRDAWPSVFPGEFRGGLIAVQAAVPAGAAFLVVCDEGKNPGVGWYARLWQRGLYPRNPVVVVTDDFRPQRLAEIRRRYGLRYAISIGDPPFDPGFRWHRDLGVVTGSLRMWFGEIEP